MGSTHVGITGDDKGMWNSILIKVVNSDLKEHIFINLVISSPLNYLGMGKIFLMSQI